MSWWCCSNPAATEQRLEVSLEGLEGPAKDSHKELDSVPKLVVETAAEVKGVHIDDKPKVALLDVPERPERDRAHSKNSNEQPSMPSQGRERMVSVASQCKLRGEAYTQGATTTGHVIFEMSGDLLCARVMHVTWKDAEGQEQTELRGGYRGKVFVPETATDISVRFSVVGGANVYKVDRNQRSFPWIKENGQYVIEKFEYPANPPQHTQFFLRGSTLRSWVAAIDERTHAENLIEMVSRDVRSVRTMIIKYDDQNGVRQKWTGSGYNVKHHLESTATNIQVTFSAVGGRKCFKVDRRNPKLPFIKDANGRMPVEKFVWSQLPSSVVFEIRGSALQPYISSVFENEASDTAKEVVCERWMDPASLFAVPLEEMPGIGGVVDISLPHSEFLLPPEVVLFEPSKSEIFNPTTNLRQIFLNTPLTADECSKLQEFREQLVSNKIIPDADCFPRYLETCALRIVQQSKGNWTKAVDLAKACAKERVQRLPIAEADVIEDIKGGFIYWHGRDRKCRPLLVIRLERIGAMAKDKERAVKAVLFSLEYALRYIFVPGRVENWVVIIDLENVFSVVSPFMIGSLVGVASAIATALEKVYCGRMVWVKIINMPSSMLAKAINGVIPAEKKDKVAFPTDVAAEVAHLFEPNQLEKRYGGAAADTQVGNTYPFRFFPNCRGDTDNYDQHEDEDAGDGGQAPELLRNRTYSEWRDTEDLSVHESTTLEFHEGSLWDESSAQAKERWHEKAKRTALSTESAQALSKAGVDVEPVLTMARFIEVVNPEALEGRSGRAKTDIDWETARLADDIDDNEDDDLKQEREKSISAGRERSVSGDIAKRERSVSPKSIKSIKSTRSRKGEDEKVLTPEEQAAEEERQRLELEQARAEAKKEVDTWLRAKHFQGLEVPKTSCMGSQFPVHKAVRENNAKIVKALVLAGADLTSRNSKGLTGLELAWKLNRRGSHEAVILILGSA